jgi:hypothetical protein
MSVSGYKWPRLPLGPAWEKGAPFQYGGLSPGPALIRRPPLQHLDQQGLSVQWHSTGGGSEEGTPASAVDTRMTEVAVSSRIQWYSEVTRRDLQSQVQRRTVPSWGWTTGSGVANCSPVSRWLAGWSA